MPVAHLIGLNGPVFILASHIRTAFLSSIPVSYTHLLAAAGAAFLLALLLELLLFNFRWLGSLSNQPLKGLVPAAGSGMTDNGDGTYTVRSRGEPILEFTGIGHKLDNIHLDAEVLQEDKEGITAPSKKVRTFSFVILAQDEAKMCIRDRPDQALQTTLTALPYRSSKLCSLYFCEFFS